MNKKYEQMCDIHEMMPITCNNLVVRLYKLKDAGLFYKYTSDKVLTQYLMCNPSTRYQSTETFVMGIVNLYRVEKVTRFIIADKETDNLIGAISIYIAEDGSSAELGYWLGRKYWGNGYMSNILHIIVNKLRELKYIRRIFINVDVNNIGSIKSAEKAGLKHDGQLPVISNGRGIITMEVKTKRVSNLIKAGVLND